MDDPELIWVNEIKMSMDDFAKLVQRMRELKKRYFDARDSAVLGNAKEVERQVDAAIEAMEGKQGTLPGMSDAGSRGLD